MLGGTVTDTLGITVGGQGATGTIIGFGTIAANVTGGGVKGVADTITASGGTLVLTGVFTDGAGGTFVPTIDSASPSTLKFDDTATVAQPIAMSSANADAGDRRRRRADADRSRNRQQRHHQDGRRHADRYRPGSASIPPLSWLARAWSLPAPFFPATAR